VHLTFCFPISSFQRFVRGFISQCMGQTMSVRQMSQVWGVLSELLTAELKLARAAEAMRGAAATTPGTGPTVPPVADCVLKWGARPTNGGGSVKVVRESSSAHILMEGRCACACTRASSRRVCAFGQAPFSLLIVVHRGRSSR
jgi:hypothetical protein